MPANQRRRHLRDIEPEKVDLVDRAANKRKFIVLKEDAMPDNLGPELEIVSDEELRSSSGGGIDLEKATAALSNLTAAVEVLKEQIEKDEPVTDEQMQQAEAAAQAAAEVAEGSEGTEGTDKGDPAAALAAVGEKAMMWAKELAEGGDPAKVAEYVKELVAMLEDLSGGKPEGEGEGDKPPAPPPPAPPPRGDQEEKRAPADVLKSVAEAALGLASKIETDAVISAESVGTIDELIAKVSAIASEAEIAKAESVELSEEIKNTKELGSVAKGMVSFLRDIASRTGTVASTMTEELSDVAKKEIGWVQAALEAAKGCVPDHVTKSESSFQSTVQAVAERALFLSRKMAGVDDKQAQKEAEQLLGLMSSLVEKYADRKEAGFDLVDYNVVIDVDRQLNAIEDVIHKAEEAAAAEAAPAPEAKAEDDTQPGGEPPKPDEVKPDEGSTETETSKDEGGEGEGEGEGQDDKDAQDLSKALMERITALTGQVTELQSFIAKARNTVPSPAGSGEPDGEGGDDGSSDMLFPMDYNDPAYKVDLDQDGEE
jgi:hypothetical protein